MEGKMASTRTTEKISTIVVAKIVLNLDVLTMGEAFMG
jgi:hypothetical protein